MTLIGEIYRDGYAVRQDQAEAARWYRLASAQGDREAAFALGALLLNGAPGVDKDRVGAKAEFEKAAAQGPGPSALQSRRHGDRGRFVRQARFRQGRRLFPSRRRSRRRQRRLFLRRPAARGTRRPLDITESAHWLKRAADGGHHRRPGRICDHAVQRRRRREERGRGGQDLSPRGGAQQPDRAKPPRPSLPDRPRRAARSGRGGDVESLRQGRRPRRRRTRRRGPPS